MRSIKLKLTLKIAALVATGLFLCANDSDAQINLAAAPTSLTLSDGSTVPMWGYSCLPATSTSSPATCAKLNPSAAGWSPVVITVATGQDLTINLTNNLSFANGNNIPTSLTIVGQMGGGLGGGGTYVASPVHQDLSVTWSTAGAPGSFTPPPQGQRVQSFGTEVGAGSTTSLTWKAPQAGTYLLESGTHPSIQGPMGLYGVVVVTSPAASGSAGTAYPGVNYNSDVTLVFSELDPVQNNAVNMAVNTAGFNESTVWSGQPGGCGNATSPNYHTCYPPAVNYTPLYYLVNGVGI